MGRYFGRFGEIDDVVVMRDKVSNRSKGFGFVRFNDAGVVRDVLATCPHSVDGKTVDVKECLPRQITDVRADRAYIHSLY